MYHRGIVIQGPNNKELRKKKEEKRSVKRATDRRVNRLLRRWSGWEKEKVSECISIGSNTLCFFKKLTCLPPECAERVMSKRTSSTARGSSVRMILSSRLTTAQFLSSIQCFYQKAGLIQISACCLAIQQVNAGTSLDADLVCAWWLAS